MAYEHALFSNNPLIKESDVLLTIVPSENRFCSKNPQITLMEKSQLKILNFQ